MGMVMNNQSVVCIGELLIDFFCTDIDVSLTEGSHFLKNAGGAPANVTAAIARLGGHAAFVGKVGRDPFGFFLKKTLDDVEVDTSMLVMDETAPTTLAFVSLQNNGERDFVFHRGADALLTMDDVQLEIVMTAKLLHFGSATAMLSDPFCDVYFKLMETAQKEGKFISFDPNYRMDLWKGREADFIHSSKKAMALADFVKVSDEEIQIITGETEIEAGVQVLHRLGAKTIAVTLGKEGTFLSHGEEQGVVPSISIKSIDSTGAGDAFVGATLYQLAQMDNPKDIDYGELYQMINFANKVGALVCTKMGAIAALPTLTEVDRID